MHNYITNMDKLFSNKRTYKTEMGEEFIDMSIPSLTLKKLNANSYVRLNLSHNGRLDRFVYETVSRDLDDGLDMTMYINHIFNPFAVKEGDILYTPVNNDDVYKKQTEPILPDNTKLSDRTTATKQMTYAERVEYLAKMGMGITIN